MAENTATGLYLYSEIHEYGMNPKAFKLMDGTYADEIIMVNFLDGEEP